MQGQAQNTPIHIQFLSHFQPAMSTPTASRTDTFTITHGHPADAAAIESTERNAGAHSIIDTLLWSPALPGSPSPSYPPPRPPTPGGERAALAGDDRPHGFVLSRMERPERFEYVVARREADGAVVGYALWEWHGGRSFDEWRHFWETRHRPAHMNLGLCDVTSGQRVLKRPGILGERPYASTWKPVDGRWKLTLSQICRSCL
jgi:hypothetical protein